MGGIFIHPIPYFEDVPSCHNLRALICLAPMSILKGIKSK